MQYYVGLDVSVKETSVCIIDKAGKVIRDVKVATEGVWGSASTATKRENMTLGSADMLFA